MILLPVSRTKQQMGDKKPKEVSQRDLRELTEANHKGWRLSEKTRGRQPNRFYDYAQKACTWITFFSWSQNCDEKYLIPFCTTV